MLEKNEEKVVLKVMGVRLKFFREKFNLSIAEMAAEIGDTEELLNEIEDGRFKDENIAIIHKLHEKYRLTPNWLFFGKGAMLADNSGKEVRLSPESTLKLAQMIEEAMDLRA
ncbi:MAG: helix-turn-helix transcriptional regulator [bacterium]|nr:helix-turn-helix transcriptional regulator [bacterium]